MENLSDLDLSSSSRVGVTYDSPAVLKPPALFGLPLENMKGLSHPGGLGCWADLLLMEWPKLNTDWFLREVDEEGGSSLGRVEAPPEGSTSTLPDSLSGRR